MEIYKKLEADGWMIAMHGYHHVYDSDTLGKVCGERLSEFAGHTYEVQLHKLATGLEILKLHNINTNIFIAPGHSYDNKTIAALKQLGFEYISDGGATWNFYSQGIKFIPCKNGGIDQIRRGINTICIHSNNITDQSLALLENIMEKYGENNVNFKWLCENYEKYKKNFWLMQLDEWRYIFYERKIRKPISPIYQKTLKMRMQNGEQEN